MTDSKVSLQRRSSGDSTPLHACLPISFSRLSSSSIRSVSVQRSRRRTTHQSLRLSISWPMVLLQASRLDDSVCSSRKPIRFACCRSSGSPKSSYLNSQNPFSLKVIPTSLRSCSRLQSCGRSVRFGLPIEGSPVLRDTGEPGRTHSPRSSRSSKPGWILNLT